MAKAALFLAVAASGVPLFASVRETETLKVLGTHPDSTSDDQVIDVDAIAGPILASLSPVDRACIQAVLARQGGGINPLPKPLLSPAEAGGDTAKPSPEGNKKGGKAAG